MRGLNAAYVVLGLLYGQGDMTRTISIATRAGQDSDCNPSSAAGILGAIIGYASIPAFWKQGLAAVEPVAVQYAGLSLNDAYRLSFKHALDLIRRNGGQVADDHVILALQPVEAVRVEQNFDGSFSRRRDPAAPPADRRDDVQLRGDWLRRAGQRAKRERNRSGHHDRHVH